MDTTTSPVKCAERFEITFSALRRKTEMRVGKVRIDIRERTKHLNEICPKPRRRIIAGETKITSYVDRYMRRRCCCYYVRREFPF